MLLLFYLYRPHSCLKNKIITRQCFQLKLSARIRTDISTIRFKAILDLIATCSGTLIKWIKKKGKIGWSRNNRYYLFVVTKFIMFTCAIDDEVEEIKWERERERERLYNDRIDLDNNNKKLLNGLYSCLLLASSIPIRISFDWIWTFMMFLNLRKLMIHVCIKNRRLF